ncbi:hypothetical protein NHP190012_09980 [Helicobacter sp. NHP19-012]|uniref:Uncharacterized protein n=1 Tax=Helicobacter gastrofelis TaxID=2849642 RepID=A0ABM7SEX5_9HELI|nr:MULTISPECIES: glycosyltransferase family 1 protein [unclassified Helicobacter]BCZ19356.1 hypothetical protein NHP190012_09980 [Helicobacter sp. NHP19-012]GMB96827.1 hypothetical protein NHP22001_14160 [Helicobacter sp. NHP22-001]
MKKIIVNASYTLGKVTGIGVYSLALIHALEKRFRDTDVDLVYYANGKLFNDLPSLEKFQSLAMPNSFVKSSRDILKKWLPKWLFWLACYFSYNILHKTMNRGLFQETYDLCIEPGVLGILGINGKTRKTLGCVHDIPPCDMEAWRCKPETYTIWEFFIFPQIRTYDQVICFTETVRKDILKTFGFSETKVHVIHHGVRSYRQTSEDLPPNLGEFILVVGKARRKNIKNLIKAFELLPAASKQRFKIVITGVENGPIDRGEDNAIASSDFVIDLGYVSDSLLSALYAHARLLWWGSLAEGFGLPMLEAMHVGCVVLSSDVSCMPEILGDAGIYCNPYNVQDIAKQLERALTDEALRTECIAKGFERVKLFDFEESMRKHIEIVEKMLD